MSAALYRLRTQRDDAVANGVGAIWVPTETISTVLREYDRQNMQLRRAHALIDAEPNNEEDE